MTQDLTRVISTILDGGLGHSGGGETPLPGLGLLRSYARGVGVIQHGPALCVVAQGEAEAVTAGATLSISGMQALVVTVDLPTVSRVTGASASRPFIAATLPLDMKMMMDVEMRLSRQPPGAAPVGGSIIVDIDPPLSASLVRLLALNNRPEAIEILFPAIMRELCYRLLAGPAGPEIARLVVPARIPAWRQRPTLH